jgi:hypothetical protein
MSARLLFVSLFVWVFAATPVNAADATEPLEARVRAGLETTGEVWVGQQIGLSVDILTTGFTFAKQRIHLPQVIGALVLEDAVTTINLSEDIEGKRWQVLRYRYPMFVQRAGYIEVPSINVAFEVSKGYGRDGVAFDLGTDRVSLSVLRPPGVTDLQNLVTTTRFNLDVAVTPTADSWQVGDAFTRTITRAATGVSGMAFEPLPLPEIAGVAVYPDDQVIEDSSNRGELKGSRVDAVTFVLQAAGDVKLPAMALQWWDPVAAELHRETIPALTLNVVPNPALRETENANLEPSGKPLAWVCLALVAVLGLFGWAAARRFPQLSQPVRRRAQARAQAEPARFKRLQRACRKNDAVLAYNAYLHWIAAEQAPAADLLQATTLRVEREKVQHALINADVQWRGSSFAQAARQARRQQKRGTAGVSKRELAALNP